MRSSLRILSMANVPRDFNAGAAGVELETVLALRELGHHVDDVWSDTVGRRIAHGNLHQLLELPRRYANIVRRRLEAAEYDIVHVNQPHGWAAAKWVRRHRPDVAFVHRSHGFEPRVAEVLDHWERVFGSDSRGLARKAASAAMRIALSRHNRLITRWADGHIVCSRQDAAYMVERFGVEARRVAALPQAAPASYLQEPLAPMTAERARTVLYVGQLAFVKAPMVLATAMDQIARQARQARFVWVTGPGQQAAVRELLTPAVQARLELLSWMPQPELREVYDRCGIFLFPSFFEGSGKAHLEALSRGLCVVASDVGGMRDTLADGVTGALVAPGDAAAFAAHAVALMSDPVRAQAMSAAAARKARELSWRRTAVETADFYRRLLDWKEAQ